MSAALERLKQHDARQELPAGQSDKVMEVLASILTAVEAQNSRLGGLAERQQKLASYVKIMDEETTRKIENTEQRLRQSIMSASVPAPDSSSMTESIRTELNEIGQTLSSLAGVIDGKQIADAVSALTSAKTQIEKTTAWNSEQSNQFVKKYQHALNAAGRAIIMTKDHAVEAIRESTSATADEAAGKIDAAIEHLDAGRQATEHLMAVAERLQKPLGWAAAARMSLALLPVTVVLLMGVQTIWTLVVGVQWVLAQDWALWLNITAGTGLAALIAGAGFGLWRLSVWVKKALDEAAMRLERKAR